MQTVRGVEKLERCRLGASQQVPFACAEGCVFYESRKTSSAGWHVAEQDRPESSPPEK
jgi:hypothetical protein